MRLRPVALVLLALLARPAVSVAGPVSFELTRTGFWVQPDQATLVAALYPTFNTGSFVVDPASGNATVVGPLVQYDAALLPTPDPIHLHPDGSATTWSQAGYFRVDLRLTDTASGEFADISIHGLAHADNAYYSGSWTGGVAYWFGNSTLVERATLGGNEYVLWGQQAFTGVPPAVSVWVGDNPPVPWVPEPATIALVGLGAIPFGLRALRRRAEIGALA